MPRLPGEPLSTITASIVAALRASPFITGAFKPGNIVDAFAGEKIKDEVAPADLPELVVVPSGGSGQPVGVNGTGGMNVGLQIAVTGKDRNLIDIADYRWRSLIALTALGPRLGVSSDGHGWVVKGWAFSFVELVTDGEKQVPLIGSRAGQRGMSVLSITVNLETIGRDFYALARKVSHGT